jgi:hypothetical protein
MLCHCRPRLWLRQPLPRPLSDPCHPCSAEVIFGFLYGSAEGRKVPPTPPPMGSISIPKDLSLSTQRICPRIKLQSCRIGLKTAFNRFQHAVVLVFWLIASCHFLVAKFSKIRVAHTLGRCRSIEPFVSGNQLGIRTLDKSIPWKHVIFAPASLYLPSISSFKCFAQASAVLRLPWAELFLLTE